jgi:hypothetical protein
MFVYCCEERVATAAGQGLARPEIKCSQGHQNTLSQNHFAPSFETSG